MQMRTRHRWLRSFAAATAAALLLAVIPVAGALAGAPQAVTIESTMDIHDPANTGDFTRTSGSNLICGSGTVLDTRYVWGASRGRGGNPNGLQLQVDKTFDCGDGLIYLRLQIHGVLSDETFTWVILGGTGPYARLRGNGSGTTDSSDFDNCSCVTNFYSGSLIG
jgi:hypothetical protein